MIYTLNGRINPSNSLAVALDVGTNNETLLNDPLYVGWPHKRVRGEEYDAFIDRFAIMITLRSYPNTHP